MIEEVIRENKEKEEEIAFSIKVRLEENREMIDFLSRTVVAEMSQVISNDVVQERVFKLWPSTVGVFNIVLAK